MLPPRPSHGREFRFRRTQNWLTLGFTYAAMYMARYNFGFANKALSDEYGWNKAQVGTIISAATLVYGISALFNGPLADRFGGRRRRVRADDRLGGGGAAVAVEVLPARHRRGGDGGAHVPGGAGHARGGGPRVVRPAGRDQRRNRKDHVRIRREPRVHAAGAAR